MKETNQEKDSQKLRKPEIPNKARKFLTGESQNLKEEIASFPTERKSHSDHAQINTVHKASKGSEIHAKRDTDIYADRCYQRYLPEEQITCHSK